MKERVKVKSKRVKGWSTFLKQPTTLLPFNLLPLPCPKNPTSLLPFTLYPFPFNLSFFTKSLAVIVAAAMILTTPGTMAWADRTLYNPAYPHTPSIDDQEENLPDHANQPIIVPNGHRGYAPQVHGMMVTTSNGPEAPQRMYRLPVLGLGRANSSVTLQTALYAAQGPLIQNLAFIGLAAAAGDEQGVLAGATALRPVQVQYATQSANGLRSERVVIPYISTKDQDEKARQLPSVKKAMESQKEGWGGVERSLLSEEKELAKISDDVQKQIQIELETAYAQAKAEVARQKVEAAAKEAGRAAEAAKAAADKAVAAAERAKKLAEQIGGIEASKISKENAQAAKTMAKNALEEVEQASKAMQQAAQEAERLINSLYERFEGADPKFLEKLHGSISARVHGILGQGQKALGDAREKALEAVKSAERAGAPVGRVTDVGFWEGFGKVGKAFFTSGKDAGELGWAALLVGAGLADMAWGAGWVALPIAVPILGGPLSPFSFLGATNIIAGVSATYMGVRRFWHIAKDIATREPNTLSTAERFEQLKQKETKEEEFHDATEKKENALHKAKKAASDANKNPHLMAAEKLNEAATSEYQEAIRTAIKDGRIQQLLNDLNTARNDLSKSIAFIHDGKNQTTQTLPGLDGLLARLQRSGNKGDAAYQAVIDKLLKHRRLSRDAVAEDKQGLAELSPHESALVEAYRRALDDYRDTAYTPKMSRLQGGIGMDDARFQRSPLSNAYIQSDKNGLVGNLMSGFTGIHEAALLGGVPYLAGKAVSLIDENYGTGVRTYGLGILTNSGIVRDVMDFAGRPDRFTTERVMQAEFGPIKVLDDRSKEIDFDSIRHKGFKNWLNYQFMEQGKDNWVKMDRLSAFNQIGWRQAGETMDQYFSASRAQNGWGSWSTWKPFLGSLTYRAAAAVPTIMAFNPVLKLVTPLVSSGVAWLARTTRMMSATASNWVGSSISAVGNRAIAAPFLYDYGKRAWDVAKEVGEHVIKGTSFTAEDKQRLWAKGAGIVAESIAFPLANKLVGGQPLWVGKGNFADKLAKSSWEFGKDWGKGIVHFGLEIAGAGALNGLGFSPWQAATGVIGIQGLRDHAKYYTNTILPHRISGAVDAALAIRNTTLRPEVREEAVSLLSKQDIRTSADGNKVYINGNEAKGLTASNPLLQRAINLRAEDRGRLGYIKDAISDAWSRVKQKVGIEAPRMAMATVGGQGGLGNIDLGGPPGGRSGNGRAGGGGGRGADLPPEEDFGHQNERHNLVSALNKARQRLEQNPTNETLAAEVRKAEKALYDHDDGPRNELKTQTEQDDMLARMRRDELGEMKSKQALRKFAIKQKDVDIQRAREAADAHREQGEKENQALESGTEARNKKVQALKIEMEERNKKIQTLKVEKANLEVEHAFREIELHNNADNREEYHLKRALRQQLDVDAQVKTVNELKVKRDKAPATELQKAEDELAAAEARLTAMEAKRTVMEEEAGAARSLFHFREPESLRNARKEANRLESIASRFEQNVSNEKKQAQQQARQEALAEWHNVLSTRGKLRDMVEEISKGIKENAKTAGGEISRKEIEQTIRREVNDFINNTGHSASAPKSVAELKEQIIRRATEKVQQQVQGGIANKAQAQIHQEQATRDIETLKAKGVEQLLGKDPVDLTSAEREQLSQYQKALEQLADAHKRLQNKDAHASTMKEVAKVQETVLQARKIAADEAVKQAEVKNDALELARAKHEQLTVDHEMAMRKAKELKNQTHEAKEKGSDIAAQEEAVTQAFAEAKRLTELKETSLKELRHLETKHGVGRQAEHQLLTTEQEMALLAINDNTSEPRLKEKFVNKVRDKIGSASTVEPGEIDRAIELVKNELGKDLEAGKELPTLEEFRDRVAAKALELSKLSKSKEAISNDLNGKVKVENSNVEATIERMFGKKAGDLVHPDQIAQATREVLRKHTEAMAKEELETGKRPLGPEGHELMEEIAQRAMEIAADPLVKMHLASGLSEEPLGRKRANGQENHYGPRPAGGEIHRTEVAYQRDLASAKLRQIEATKKVTDLARQLDEQSSIKTRMTLIQAESAAARADRAVAKIENKIREARQAQMLRDFRRNVERGLFKEKWALLTRADQRLMRGHLDLLEKTGRWSPAKDGVVHLKVTRLNRGEILAKVAEAQEKVEDQIKTQVIAHHQKLNPKAKETDREVERDIREHLQEFRNRWSDGQNEAVATIARGDSIAIEMSVGSGKTTVVYGTVFARILGSDPLVNIDLVVKNVIEADKYLRTATLGKAEIVRLPNMIEALAKVRGVPIQLVDMDAIAHKIRYGNEQERAEALRDFQEAYENPFAFRVWTEGELGHFRTHALDGKTPREVLETMDRASLDTTRLVMIDEGDTLLSTAKNYVQSKESAPIGELGLRSDRIYEGVAETIGFKMDISKEDNASEAVFNKDARVVFTANRLEYAQWARHYKGTERGVFAVLDDGTVLMTAKAAEIFESLDLGNGDRVRQAEFGEAERVLESIVHRRYYQRAIDEKTGERVVAPVDESVGDPQVEMVLDDPLRAWAIARARGADATMAMNEVRLSQTHLSSSIGALFAEKSQIVLLSGSMAAVAAASQAMGIQPLRIGGVKDVFTGANWLKYDNPDDIAKDVALRMVADYKVTGNRQLFISENEELREAIMKELIKLEVGDKAVYLDHRVQSQAARDIAIDESPFVVASHSKGARATNFKKNKTLWGDITGLHIEELADFETWRQLAGRVGRNIGELYSRNFISLRSVVESAASDAFIPELREQLIEAGLARLRNAGREVPAIDREVDGKPSGLELLRRHNSVDELDYQEKARVASWVKNLNKSSQGMATNMPNMIKELHLGNPLMRLQAVFAEGTREHDLLRDYIGRMLRHEFHTPQAQENAFGFKGGEERMRDRLKSIQTEALRVLKGLESELPGGPLRAIIHSMKMEWENLSFKKPSAANGDDGSIADASTLQHAVSRALYHGSGLSPVSDGPRLGLHTLQLSRKIDDAVARISQGNFSSLDARPIRQLASRLVGMAPNISNNAEWAALAGAADATAVARILGGPQATVSGGAGSFIASLGRFVTQGVQDFGTQFRYSWQTNRDEGPVTRTFTALGAGFTSTVGNGKITPETQANLSAKAFVTSQSSELKEAAQQNYLQWMDLDPHAANQALLGDKIDKLAKAAASREPDPEERKFRKIEVTTALQSLRDRAEVHLPTHMPTFGKGVKIEHIPAQGAGGEALIRLTVKELTDDALTALRQARELARRQGKTRIEVLLDPSIDPNGNHPFLEELRNLQEEKGKNPGDPRVPAVTSQTTEGRAKVSRSLKAWWSAPPALATARFIQSVRAAADALKKDPEMTKDVDAFIKDSKKQAQTVQENLAVAQALAPLLLGRGSLNDSSVTEATAARELIAALAATSPDSNKSRQALETFLGLRSDTPSVPESPKAVPAPAKEPETKSAIDTPLRSMSDAVFAAADKQAQQAQGLKTPSIPQSKNVNLEPQATVPAKVSQVNSEMDPKDKSTRIDAQIRSLADVLAVQENFRAQHGTKLVRVLAGGVGVLSTIFGLGLWGAVPAFVFHAIFKKAFVRPSVRPELKGGVMKLVDKLKTHWTGPHKWVAISLTVLGVFLLGKYVVIPVLFQAALGKFLLGTSFIHLPLVHHHLLGFGAIAANPAVAQTQATYLNIVGLSVISFLFSLKSLIRSLSGSTDSVPGARPRLWDNILEFVTLGRHRPTPRSVAADAASQSSPQKPSVFRNKGVQLGIGIGVAAALANAFSSGSAVKAASFFVGGSGGSPFAWSSMLPSWTTASYMGAALLLLGLIVYNVRKNIADSSTHSRGIVTGAA